MKFIYKLVFLLFGISFVVPTVGKTKNMFAKYSSILLSTAILIFHAYDSFYMFYQAQGKAIMTAFFLANAIAFTHRYVLGRKFYSLKRIANIISNYEIQENYKSKYVLLFWLALSTLSQVFKLGNNMYNHRNNPHIRSLFGLKDDNYTIAFFYYFHHTILMHLPISLFAVFYTVVCYHLRCALKQFSLNSSTNNDGFIEYKNILQSINKFHDTIASFDDKLSIFVLFFTMHASYTVVFPVYYILHNSAYFTSCMLCMNQLAHFVQIADYIVTFAALTLLASLVAEAYNELQATAGRSIACLDMEFTSKQHKFLMCIEREAHFTVYKIVQIRRSFIVGVVGGVVTYMMLFDNMLKI